MVGLFNSVEDAQLILLVITNAYFDVWSNKKVCDSYYEFILKHRDCIDYKITT
jgi:hypothetical protein